MLSGIDCYWFGSDFCRQYDWRRESHRYQERKGKDEEMLGDIGRSGAEGNPDSYYVSPHFSPSMSRSTTET